jgi:hypothetical protein
MITSGRHRDLIDIKNNKFGQPFIVIW